MDTPKEQSSQPQAAAGTDPGDPAQDAAHMLELTDMPASESPVVADGMSEATQSNVVVHQPIDPLSFPNQPRKAGGQIPATPANVDHMLRSYGITARYNIVKKKVMIAVPGLSGSPDNFDNVALTMVTSLANLNGLFTGNIPSLIMAVADKNQYNPVATWITSKPWDGIDRLPAFYGTLVERSDFTPPFKETLMYRWALSAVAAALMPSGFHCRGVLTLQGPQEIGKSSWVNSLVSDPALMAEVILLNHNLDLHNKDTLITAVSHWIVEFGELDGMLKKDVARLKGFITADRDKVRRPFGRLDCEYQRKSVFVATVNDSNFLTDPTGNTRWWTIPVVSVNYKHGIDMQQLFAQLAVDFKDGKEWWLSKGESEFLELHNRQHRSVSSLHERILDAVDLKKKHDDGLPAMTPTEILRELGIDRPTNTQCKECGSVLRELFGDSRRINGRDKWRVPLRSRLSSSDTEL